MGLTGPNPLKVQYLIIKTEITLEGKHRLVS